MNIAGFLSGNFLTHLDLPAPNQVWTISKAEQKLVGNDTKVCLTFGEFPNKPLGANKTNLKRVAGLYGLDASAWAGQQLRVYRTTTAYGGKVMSCIRVVGPEQEPIDDNGNPTQPLALQSTAPVPAPMPVQQVVVPAQPVVAPAQQFVDPPQQPVAASQSPWEQDPANQQNNPPSA